MPRRKRKLRRSPLAIGFFLVLAGCQSEPAERPAAATEQEKAAATDRFIDCIRNAAPQLDDGISDAYVIAGAVIRGPCYSQSQNVVDTFTRGSNAQVKEMFSDNFFEARGKETAVDVILRERNKKLTKPSN
jgi:hypothetical protein